MKKLIVALLTTAMLFSFAACSFTENIDLGNNSTQSSTDSDNSKKDDSKKDDDSNSGESQVTVAQNDEDAKYGIGNPVHEVFTAGYSSATGAYATISVSSEIKMEADAWVGLCPAGVFYLDEREADDVDVIWFNADWREDGDPYVFACDFSDVEDGTYALVVATSDDEEVGYIVIQVQITKNGDSIDFDYSEAKLNEKPVE